MLAKIENAVKHNIESKKPKGEKLVSYDGKTPKW